MTELPTRESSRSEHLERHLANSLFHKLSSGKWRHVESGESPKFTIHGAGKAPLPPDGKHTLYTYAWTATVSPSIPRLLIPMHAIFLDEAIYTETLGMFSQQTQNDWGDLLGSGTRRLYYRQNDDLRRNTSVKPLMCAVGIELVRRLREIKLIVPVKGLDARELSQGHEEQLVLAALRH